MKHSILSLLIILALATMGWAHGDQQMVTGTISKIQNEVGHC